MWTSRILRSRTSESPGPFRQASGRGERAIRSIWTLHGWSVGPTAAGAHVIDEIRRGDNSGVPLCPRSAAYLSPSAGSSATSASESLDTT